MMTDGLLGAARRKPRVLAFGRRAPVSEQQRALDRATAEQAADGIERAFFSFAGNSDALYWRAARQTLAELARLATSDGGGVALKLDLESKGLPTVAWAAEEALRDGLAKLCAPLDCYGSPLGCDV